ncbi:hypothetical protein [Streptomyces tubercidicus]|uniref:hypothetical protein n=1 Tax=Streptomyces tubercidicus TaxID=47759 RepID=UPI002E1230D6|nr:hypothetical protein OG761_15740 [Streptomyces tubercidicus]
MPRGRHRQSPPLHRLLPPSTVAGASIACAAGAWFAGDDLVQRVLAAGAAAAALTGAVLLRTWDRKAGRQVAELHRVRVRDEWRTEERIAELETDVEEAREIRSGLEGKLRAKRAELARLRSEHADLLRRYATAETERASALEGRRLLAIEAAAPAKALPAVAGLSLALHASPKLPAQHPSSPLRTKQADGPAAGEAPRTGKTTVPARREPATDPAAATFAQADQALRRLARNAARQRAVQKAARLAREGAAADGAARSGPPAGRDAQGGRDGEKGPGKAPAAAAQRTGEQDPARTATADGPALRPVPATAVAPSRPAASRATGGFDFFGNATADGPRQLTGPLEEDLADVVGDEAVAEQSARTEPSEEPAADRGARTDGETTSGSGEVIDLTAHDETEQFDLGALRTAIS